MRHYHRFGFIKTQANTSNGGSKGGSKSGSAASSSNATSSNNASSSNNSSSNNSSSNKDTTKDPVQKAVEEAVKETSKNAKSVNEVTTRKTRKPISIEVMRDPVVRAAAKEIAKNDKLTDAQKKAAVDKVLETAQESAQESQATPTTPPPTTAPPTTAPPALAPPTTSSPIIPPIAPELNKNGETQVRPLPPNLQPAPPKDKGLPPIPIPPTPTTSIRPPAAVPRTYSSNNRVKFRASRLFPPSVRPMPRVKTISRKPSWRVARPLPMTFRPAIRPGSQLFRLRNKRTDLEVRRLRNQINSMTADAIKTKEQHARERAELEATIADYRSSPLTQVRDNAKGIFEVVDKATVTIAPTFNAMNGFPHVSEGVSKVFASGVGVLAFLYLIGRVE